MIQIIHSKIYKARKEYFDDGAENVMEWRRGGYYTNKQTLDPIDVLRIEEEATNEPYKIHKGEYYQRQFNNYEGDVGTWRTKQIFYEIMCKYKLFSED